MKTKGRKMLCTATIEKINPRGFGFAKMENGERVYFHFSNQRRLIIKRGSCVWVDEYKPLPRVGQRIVFVYNDPSEDGRKAEANPWAPNKEDIYYRAVATRQYRIEDAIL